MEKPNQPDIPYIYKRLADLEGLVQLLLAQPSGHLIEDDGSPVPQRSKLRFLGIGKRVTDNVLDDATEIDITSPAIVGQIVMDESGPQFCVVTVDGKVADSSVVSHVGRVAGIALTAPAAGFPVDCIFHGDIENPAWAFNEGDSIFLNGTALSSTPPASGFSQAIGSAKSPTKVVVNIEEPILL